MPRIVKPWEIIGSLSEKAAKLCGLVKGIPIIAGSGDQAASSLGAGIIKEGQAFDVAGTASVFSVSVENFKPDVKNKTLVYAHSIKDNMWLPMAYISGGGLCIRWFKDNFGGGKSYAELESLAEKTVPGSKNLIFIPHFSGLTCPSFPDMRGCWAGLTINHGTGELYRSILESIAYEYKTYLNKINSLNKDTLIKKVTVIGGGSKSRLFSQIKADILNLPYQSVEVNESAALGSAMTAGFGVGMYDSLDSAVEKADIRPDKIFTPDSEISKSYEPLVALYEKTIKGAKNIFKTNL
jgi:xylulokinase